MNACYFKHTGAREYVWESTKTSRSVLWSHFSCVLHMYALRQHWNDASLAQISI